MRAELDSLTDAITKRLPGLVVSHTSLSNRLEFLFRAELEVAHARAMTPLRLAQFAAGRHCARDAIAELGAEISPVLAGPEGEPLWPAGLVGSISHKGETALAAIAQAELYRSVGIDLELDEISDDGWLTEVMAPGDRFMTPVRSLATALLSAKESYYKAQFPVTRESPYWPDVCVQSAQDGTFRGIGPCGVVANGVQLATGPWIVSVCIVRHAHV
ncbi:4'-phosphopantetheinyl transferase family protein [Enhygromyxa salina]|uniref:4'-phosphopantetheinyl transferase Npt n=1 Tax=Enhygromyxa salina TaxID=215803 RepID=A0A2S9YA95_9BACT|nr:hypothetical protein [Enhygromyxa salina]PRQ02038.1 4'-phosphopantetheinyl transferase Npt [Enhygromyxa salina]